GRKACRIFVRCGDLCFRGLDSGLAGPPILSSRIGKRHPPCRGRAERGNPASAVSPHLGEILRRRPRDRLRACARSRGPERAVGASVAHLVGKVFRREWPDCRVLLAAGAGAGLATAFNAPMAGAVFVLEELVRRFELRIAVAALGASATAIAVACVFLGDAPDFHVDALAYASAEATPLFFVLGAVAGLAAIAYNRAL